MEAFEAIVILDNIIKCPGIALDMMQRKETKKLYSRALVTAIQSLLEKIENCNLCETEREYIENRLIKDEQDLERILMNHQKEVYIYKTKEKKDCHIEITAENMTKDMVEEMKKTLSKMKRLYGISYVMEIKTKGRYIPMKKTVVT